MPFIFQRLQKRGAKRLPYTQGAHSYNRRLAEASDPHLAANVLLALRTFRQRLNTPKLDGAVVSGQVMAVVQPALDELARSLSRGKLLLANVHQQAKIATSPTIRKDIVDFDFNTLPEDTQAALDGYDFGLIQQVTSDVRGNIADAVGAGIQDGYPPWKIAQVIRETVGLTAQQAMAVQNYRAMLENGSPGALDRHLRDARFDGTVQDAVDGLAPLSSSKVNQLVDRYQDRYLSYRATTIARYETLRAANQGSEDAISDAINDGTIDPADVTTYWMIADDEITCPRCRSIVELQPDGLPWGQEFQWSVATKRGGSSGSIGMAPLHPDCRCTMGYNVARQAYAEAA